MATGAVSNPRTQNENNLHLINWSNCKWKWALKNGNNPLISQTITITIVLHSLSGHIMLEKDSFSGFRHTLEGFVQSQRLLLTFVSITNYIVIITTLISVVFENKSLQFYNLANLPFRFLLGNIEIVARLTLFFTAFLAYLNFEMNITALLLASFLSLAQNLLFGNYQNKNVASYRSSSSLSMVFELWFVVTLTINTTIVKYLNTQIYAIWSLFAGVMLFCWYIRGGIKLYYDKKMCFFLCIFTALMVSLSAEYAILLIKSQNKTNSIDFIQWAFCFIIVFAYFQICKSSQTLSIITIEQLISSGRVKQLEKSINQAIEQADSKIEYLSLISGIIDEHSRRQCTNIGCWLKKRNIFDAIYQLVVSQTNYVKSQDYICKLYIKCVYQTALMSNKSPNILIDYCQFMIAEFQDLYSYYFYLEKSLSLHHLNMFSRVKVAKLRFILEEKSKNKNQTECNNLLQILQSQHAFLDILENINAYCLRQISFQTSTPVQKELDLKHIRDEVANNFQILHNLDRKWATLSKFFRLEKKLHFIYILYSLFLKNQKVKNQTLRFISQSLLQMEENTQQYSSKRQPEPFQFNLLFDPSSFIVVTVFKEQELIFYHTSKSFGKLTLYSQIQILNAPLNIILPLQIQKQHSQIVLDSFKTGKINFQAEKRIKTTYYVNKTSKHIPCTAFFKLFLDFSQQEQSFKFIAYIKQRPPFIQQNKNLVPTLQQTHILRNRKFGSFSLLSNSQNIFLKEQTIQPAKNNPKIKQIKRSIRLFALIAATITIAVFISVSADADKQIDLATTWNYILFLYRFPMALVKNYLKLSLNIGNNAQTYSNVVFATNSLSEYIKDKQTIGFLADKTINTEGLYYPYKNNSINKGIAYDQIDIFYVVMECIMTLSTNATVNRTGYEFRQLDSYIKPGFDTMINKTKLQFNYKLVEEIGSSRTKLIAVLAVAVILFVVVTIIILWRLNLFNQYNYEVFKAFINFKKYYLRRITNYWKRVSTTFKTFSTQQGQVEGQSYSAGFGMGLPTNKEIKEEKTIFLQQQEEQHQNHYSGHKQKHLYASNQLRHNYQFKAVILLAILVSILPLLSFLTYNVFQFIQLSKLQAAGFQLFRLYPANAVVGYALITKYYSTVYPQQHNFQISRYEQIISDLKIIANTNYLPNINSDSLFYQKIKNYFFGNPCTYNPDVLVTANSSIAKCISYSNRSLTLGIIPYFRYVTPQVEDYLNGRVNYSITQMDNIITGCALAGFYFSDAILSWTQEFNGQLTRLKNINFLMSILIVVLIVVTHIGVFQCWVVGELEREHGLVQDIFWHLVPSELVNDEKLVRLKFQQAGVMVI